MISQQALGEAVLSLICFHDELAIKIAPRVNQHILFSKNRTNQRIAEVALEYVKKYNTSPGMALEYILEADLQRGEEGRLLGNQINFLAKRVTEIDSTFVVDQLDRYIEIQQFQNNFEEAIELLEQGELEHARQVAFKIDSKTEDDSPTIDLTDPLSLSVLEKIEEADYFTTGIQIFNKLGIRLDRKTFGFIIASKGMGKSWWLVEVGKGGIQYHHKVLHITLEMSAEKTYLRYLQSLFALTKKETKEIKIPIFNKDEQGKFVSMDIGTSIRKSVFQSRADIKHKLEMMNRSHLLIKQFPTGHLTTQNLHLYLEQLKRNNGFEPDLLLIDYADLMQIDRSQIRVDTGRQYVELRGLAITRNLCLCTATQGNRESADAKLVKSTNVAEDWSKIATADLVLTLSRTPQEKLMNLARVYAQNARDEEDKQLALISQSYATGQFCIDSVLMSQEVTEQMSAGQSA